MSYVLGISGLWFGTHTGDGGGTSYNIPHGLDPQPDFAIITPASDDAATENFYVSSINSDNIVVVFVNATPAGTDNIILTWMAGREHSIREEIFATTRDDIGDDDTP